MILVTGFAAWAWVSRRQPRRPLSLLSRLVLALLLAATPLSWWWTKKLLLKPMDLTSAAGEGLSARTAESLGIAAPRNTSFLHPDIRPLGGRPVLMLLPPAWLESTACERGMQYINHLTC